MASITAVVSMAMPLTRPIQIQSQLFKPLPVKQSASKSNANCNGGRFHFQVKAASSSSMKQKAVTGFTAAALTASMVIPEVAQAAADAGVTPSLKNFLLSIVAGGVVLTALFGAVIGVANFDPVKRT